MFEGFTRGSVKLEIGEIVYRVGGSGPPVLLLHGHPQSHVMWHRVAPKLAERFTVVCADLRGYGDSARPRGGGDHATYAKRAMAGDQVAVMNQLGFERFALVGHDRGARVAHRLCLDYRGRVTRLCVLDIAPTLAMYEGTTMEFASAYWHWFFLIQPYPLPERFIEADPEFYVRWMFGRGEGGLARFDPEALAEYVRCARIPGSAHSWCEDYRAAASLDLDHDRADLDKRIDCPVLALWGESGVVQRCFDPLALWRARADDVRGHALPCGHYIAEEAPERLVEELVRFLQ
jgi:haloacetate dehalogenase